MFAYDWLHGIRRLKHHLTGSLLPADTTLAEAGIRQPGVHSVYDDLPQVFYFRRKPLPVQYADAGVARPAMPDR